MKKFLFPLLAIFLISCEKEDDPFLITQNSVGLLTREVQVNELDSIYFNDSIVKEVTESQYFDTSNEIKIFDKSGKQMLHQDPEQAFDSTSNIGYIQIHDQRFQTDKGLATHSIFKDIVKNYTISRIENTLSAALIFIND